MKRQRIALVVCTAVAILPVAVIGQARPSPAQLQEWQRSARTAYDLGMADDICNASTQEQENTCAQRLLGTTRADFDQFYAALKSVLGLDPMNADALERTQVLWRAYEEATCKAISDFFTPGTITASATMRCEIQLTKSRLRDLNEIYFIPLYR